MLKLSIKNIIIKNFLIYFFDHHFYQTLFHRIFAIAYVSDFFGPFRVLIFALALVALSLVSVGVISASDLNDSVDTSDVDENAMENVEPSDVSPSSGQYHSADGDARLDQALSGDAHLRIIGALCLLLWTVHYDILLVFIIIPFFVAIFIRVGKWILLGCRIIF